MIGRILGTLVLALGLLSPALPAQASTHSGVGVVWKVDLGRSTVTIGGTTYRVTASTELRGARGERLSIVQLPTAREKSGELKRASLATVAFEAVGPYDERELVSLQLVRR